MNNDLDLKKLLDELYIESPVEDLIKEKELDLDDFFSEDLEYDNLPF